MWDEHIESRKSFLVAFFRSALIPKECEANLFFSLEEVKVLRELVWICRLYQYAKERAVKGPEETGL